MSLPPLTYLTFDSLAEGVGASQVLPYVEGLVRRGMQVTLHSFEKVPPTPELQARLAASDVRWAPHRFGRSGAAGGLSRVARGAVVLRGAELVHARSDLPAASALLARREAWLWDMRSFWADERIELGLLRAGSIEERVMRRVERGAAASAHRIVTLAEAAAPVLVERHGPAVRQKVRVVTTCVDLGRFPLQDPPPAEPVRLLLSGTLNSRYDVPVMVRLAEVLGRRRPVELEVLCPDPGRWEGVLRSAGATIGQAAPAEMPQRVGAVHAGLSVLRSSPGVASRASMPTKIGELLACGRPVVVSGGLGDMDALVRGFDCGVVLPGDSEEALDRAAGELERLVEDPGAPGRCRAAAEASFDLERGVEALLEAYDEISSPARSEASRCGSTGSRTGSQVGTAQ
jgi:hypothetical protein